MSGAALAACAGWVTAVAGLASCAGRLHTGALGLAVAGLTCVGVVARSSGRRLIWVGLVVLETAWCCWLVAAGVGAIEPYTLPPAAVGVGAGLARSAASRRCTRVACARARPGRLAGAQPRHGLAERRLAPAVLLGAAVVVLDAAHELAPVVGQVIGALPTWMPIAVLGTVLVMG